MKQFIFTPANRSIQVYRVILLTYCLTVSVLSFSQNENIFQKGTDEYKMFMAKQDFSGGDYRSAATKYKDVLKTRPKDPSLQFFLGESYYMMREYTAALEHLETAKKMSESANENLSLVLGKTYHVKGMLDNAISELTKYRQSIASNSKKLKETEVDVHLSQCNIAKQLMAKPVNIIITPLADINSKYDDKGPVLSNGDKVLTFTSRRPGDSKAIIDSEGDYGYFDDIYESYWSDEKQVWLPADKIKGAINSQGYDACSSISEDGKIMFIYRNNPGEARGGEIFMSKKSSNGKWRTPEMLLKPINTSYYEDAACISPDGNTLYFVSERPNGLGRADIWVSKKVAKEWSEPVNIGAPINSEFDENGLYLHPDGKTLFFCSNGPGSMGFYDIFRTTQGSDGRWTTPVNVGYPINTVNMETKFVTTADKKTAFISSVRDSGMGERDILMVDLSYYNAVTGESVVPPKPSVLTGMVMGSDSIAVIAEIKIIDKINSTTVSATKSRENGAYSIEFAGDKQFILEITCDGFEKNSQEITLPAGKTESKNIILSKKN